MLEKLTKAQESMLAVYRDKFIALGLKTGPIDRQRVRAIIDKVYQCGGLPPPTTIFILDGPIQGISAANLIEQGATKVTKAACLVMSPKMKEIWPATYGQHEAGWLSFYAFFNDQCNIPLPQAEGMLGQLELGWCWLYPDIAVVIERPSCLHTDAQGRLHSAIGPALQYPDGFSIWSWHGVGVTEQIIMRPNTLTVQQIQSEANVEIRRVMIELYGQEKYIRDAGASVMAMDEIGILYNLPQAGDEDIKMVRVLNSTPEADGTRREYMLRVPPAMVTPKEAVAWTFGRKEKDYAPQKES